MQNFAKVFSQCLWNSVATWHRHITYIQRGRPVPISCPSGRWWYGTARTGHPVGEQSLVEAVTFGPDPWNWRNPQHPGGQENAHERISALPRQVERPSNRGQLVARRDADTKGWLFGGGTHGTEPWTSFTPGAWCRSIWLTGQWFPKRTEETVWWIGSRTALVISFFFTVGIINYVMYFLNCQNQRKTILL